MKLRPLTRKQAVEESGLSRATIDRLIRSGELPARKFKRAVRIDGEAFSRWLAKHRISGEVTA